jgi:ABC-type amino acid transport substrate-binding protein/cytochrome c5
MLVATLALGALGLVAAARAETQVQAPLRLCADPTNPPFSTDDPKNPGAYIEIGDAIGRAIGRPVSHVWYRTYFGGRAVRVTMLAKQCDAMIGLPDDKDFMGPRVIFSKPLFDIGYAVVLPAHKAFGSLADLQGTRVAVQFSTAPQNILATRNDMTAVTVLSPEEGMQALADGRADAAFIWGPTAGYLNQTAYRGAYKITSVEGEGLSWPAAIGFPKTETALRDTIDGALPGLSESISDLAGKYGFPSGPRLKLKATSETETTATVAATSEAKPAKPDAPAPGANTAAIPPATPAVIAEGKEVFNGTCAHCHGPDGVQSEKRIDLRRLGLRYGADMHSVFWKTVHEGRTSKGMPVWDGVFTDEQLSDIYAFLSTIQSQE